MKPPKQEQKDYELVKTGDFITGIIDNIEYDEKHSFKFKGEEKIAPGVRLVFMLEGYEHPHRTRWMKFIYAEKANLYKKIIVPLVAVPMPYMEFDLDNLKGMKVKTIWINNEYKGKTYQNLDLIRPADKKWIDAVVKDSVPPEALNPEEESESDDEVPF